MPISFRMLPDSARSKFSKIEQAADQFRQTQAFAHERATQIRRIFGMNASIDAAERRQLEAELKDHEDTLRSASENYKAAAVVHSTVRSWIEKLIANPNGRALEDAPKTKPPLQKGEGLRSCLDRLRKEIADIKRALYTTSLAPLPASDLKLHAAEYVKQMAASAKPAPFMKDGTFQLGWFGGTTPTAIPPGAVFGMICAVDPAQATKFLEGVIDAMPKPNAPALSVFDRGQKLKDLGEQLDLLERQEEACVLALHREGSINVARRADANPLALLGIQFAKPSKPSSLKPVPRANGNGNGADHEPERQKRKRARVRPKVTREDDRDTEFSAR